jgi:hypothetical protein
MSNGQNTYSNPPDTVPLTAAVGNSVVGSLDTRISSEKFSLDIVSRTIGNSDVVSELTILLNASDIDLMALSPMKYLRYISYLLAQNS